MQCVGDVTLFSYTTNRSPLPEPYSPETEETAHVVHATSDHGARETIPQTKVPRFSRTIGTRKTAEDDRRASENLVPESTYQVEVSLRNMRNEEEVSQRNMCGRSKSQKYVLCGRSKSKKQYLM